MVHFEPLIHPEVAAKDLYFEHLEDDGSVLRVLLRDPESKRVLEMAFELPFLYRRTTESSLVATFAAASGLGQATVYTCVSSKLIDAFLAESCATPKRITHYAMFTDDECVEVLTDSDPKIRWI